GELRDAARGERQRPLLRPPRGAVLLDRPDRPRSGRGLRPAEGLRAGRGGALAASESRVRAGAQRRGLAVTAAAGWAGRGSRLRRLAVGLAGASACGGSPGGRLFSYTR